MMFAGLWLLPFGLLVYRSRFLPRFLGVWLMIACFAYLALSFSGLLFLGNEDRIFAMGQPFMWGEVATMLWLAILGARPPRAARNFRRVDSGALGGTGESRSFGRLSAPFPAPSPLYFQRWQG